jgi:hypothetical protein
MVHDGTTFIDDVKAAGAGAACQIRFFPPEQGAGPSAEALVEAGVVPELGPTQAESRADNAMEGARRSAEVED